MEGWVPLCRLDEIVDGRGRTVEVLGTRLAVLRDGEAVTVVFDRCPHAGGSLGSGWIEENEVLCPLHRWRFRLRDGRCTTVPGHNAHVIPSRVETGRVWVFLGGA